MALCTAAEVREYAGSGAAADDTLIDSIIARVDASFARYCRYPRSDAGAYTMEDTTYTVFPRADEAQDSEHPERLLLSTGPIVSVTSVHVDPERDYGASTEVGSGDYDIEATAAAIVLRDDATEAWSTATRANKVVVVAGWATVPDDLAEAAIIQASHIFKNRQSAGARTRTTGQNSRTTDRLSLLDEVKERLSPYILLSA